MGNCFRSNIDIIYLSDETSSTNSLITRLDHLHLVHLLRIVTAARLRGILSVAVTHAGLPLQQDLLAGKEPVDLLQGQVLGLWVQEVDERQEAKVEDAKVDVGAPADAGEADGGDLDDEEGEDP